MPVSESSLSLLSPCLPRRYRSCSFSLSRQMSRRPTKNKAIGRDKGKKLKVMDEKAVEWLERHMGEDAKECIAKMRKNGIKSISDLRMLSKDDLDEIGLNVGQRNRFIKAMDAGGGWGGGGGGGGGGGEADDSTGLYAPGLVNSHKEKRKNRRKLAKGPGRGEDPEQEPVIPLNFAALSAEQQRVLLEALKLTPQQIDELPPQVRAQILNIKHKLALNGPDVKPEPFKRPPPPPPPPSTAR